MKYVFMCVLFIAACVTFNRWLDSTYDLKDAGKVVNPPKKVEKHKEYLKRGTKAVAIVESGDQSKLKNGKMKIRFEQHLFRRYLKKFHVNKRFKVVSSNSYENLARAKKIHWKSAMMATSFGKFQILGSNYRECGCKSLIEFLTRIYSGDSSQVELFHKYIKNRGIDTYLRNENFAAFARRYNGPKYKKNKYDRKLIAAYRNVTED